MNPVIYIDLDDVVFNFSDAYKKARAENPEVIYPQSQVDFFRQLKPIDGAIDAVNFLMDSFPKVYFATAPSIYNPMCYMEKYLSVKDHFGMRGVKRLIIIPDKELLIGDELIDDRCDSNGQDKFTGTHIHFASDKYPNWDSVIKHIVKKYICKVPQ